MDGGARTAAVRCAAILRHAWETEAAGPPADPVCPWRAVSHGQQR